MPSQGEKIKETVILSLLNIGLPSVDVGSDIALMIKFYVGSRSNPYCHDCYDTPHYTWGTMMLVPFLLNYLICWYVWATTDKRKAFTWVHSSAKKLFTPGQEAAGARPSRAP